MRPKRRSGPNPCRITGHSEVTAQYLSKAHFPDNCREQGLPIGKTGGDIHNNKSTRQQSEKPANLPFKSPGAKHEYSECSDARQYESGDTCLLPMRKSHCDSLHSEAFGAGQQERLRITVGNRGGLNGSTQHQPEVQSAVVSMAKFVRER
jgi:hypothetical protein